MLIEIEQHQSLIQRILREFLPGIAVRAIRMADLVKDLPVFLDQALKCALRLRNTLSYRDSPHIAKNHTGESKLAENQIHR